MLPALLLLLGLGFVLGALACYVLVARVRGTLDYFFILYLFMIWWYVKYNWEGKECLLLLEWWFVYVTGRGGVALCMSGCLLCVRRRHQHRTAKAAGSSDMIE